MLIPSPNVVAENDPGTPDAIAGESKASQLASLPASPADRKSRLNGYILLEG
jgi:hypothetical protein